MLSATRSPTLHGAQPPASYQTAALTVGAAVAFGAGVYALKGADAVRPCARLRLRRFAPPSSRVRHADLLAT